MGMKIPDFAKQVLSTYDKNQDGKVDRATENTAQVIGREMYTLDGTRLLAAADKNNDGSVTLEELTALVAPFDKNHDGKISDLGDNPLATILFLLMGSTSAGVLEALGAGTEAGEFEKAYPQK